MTDRLVEGLWERACTPITFDLSRPSPLSLERNVISHTFICVTLLSLFLVLFANLLIACANDRLVEGLWGKGLAHRLPSVVGTSPLSFERNDGLHKIVILKNK